MKASHRRMILGALALTLGVEMYGVFHPDQDYTISELLRDTFHTDTKAGKIIFSAATFAVAGLLVPHIINDGGRPHGG